jgi:hypothetical protein
MKKGGEKRIKQGEDKAGVAVGGGGGVFHTDK